MKSSSRLCWALCYPNEDKDFCTRAPGSCLTVSFDQTHPPGRRITEETFLCEDRPAESTTSARGRQQSAWLSVAVPGCMSPARSEEESGGGGRRGERVRAAAGGLCELSVWLLIIQNGCKVETVLSLCGPYHSPRRRIWPDSVPTQRGRRRARTSTHVAVGKNVNLASAHSVMYCALWKPWTWALGTGTKEKKSSLPPHPPKLPE